MRTGIRHIYVHPHIQLKISGSLYTHATPGQSGESSSKWGWVWGIPKGASLFVVPNCAEGKNPHRDDKNTCVRRNPQIKFTTNSW